MISNSHSIPKKVSIDIELTNACNASCTFCPRDHMPKIGTIKAETFYRAVERGLEYPARPKFTFCGTGDALMNKHIVEYAQHVCSTGSELRIATNGHLLDEEKAEALIDAGVSRLTFSISSRGEKYRKEYGLDYETTHQNILRFIALAEGKCKVRVAMVLHDESTPYEEDEAYWRSLGIESFHKYDLINRAGALFPIKELSAGEVEAAKLVLERRGEFDVCFTPFLLLFVGWDGHYYLCSSDWEKKVPVGHVDTHSIEETYLARRRAVESRSPICSQCPNDPANKLMTKSSEFRDRMNLAVTQVL